MIKRASDLNGKHIDILKGMIQQQNEVHAKTNRINRVLWQMRVWKGRDREKRDQF